MIFITGGAYQGKLRYAKTEYDLAEHEIFTCTGPEIDFSVRCINAIEEFTYACVQDGIEPLDYFLGHEAEWKDSILICQDIFCGVVPLGAEQREWRQATGRLCKYLSQQAGSVVRMFCGLEQRLK